MAYKSSKILQRSELNQAIEEYIARGGRIKKIEIQSRERSEGEVVMADNFEQGYDCMDYDNDTFIGNIKQDTIDF